MKNKLIKRLFLGVVVISAMFVNSVDVQAAWKQDKHGWWYQTGSKYYESEWKQINGKWYCFDESGYLCTDKIVPGYYYVNSNGEWVTPPVEVQKYINVLKNSSLSELKYKYNFNISNVNYHKSETWKARIIDINDDGVYEAIVDNSTNHANEKATVLEYKNGEVKVMKELEYCVYKVPGKNIVVAFGAVQGKEFGTVYEVKGEEFTIIHKYSATPDYNHYEIDNVSVSQEQFNKFMKSYDPNGVRFYVYYSN